VKTVAEFEVHWSGYLDPDGNPLGDLPPMWSESDCLRELYRWMVLTRTFDTKAVQMQRTGRLGTYASCLGQEAAAVGIAAAMAPNDVLIPSFREQGAQLYRGVTLLELFQSWGGDERGADYADTVARGDFPMCITVGGHAPHAAGVALALKLSGGQRAAVCTFGDGATSKGDVYEAMNVAGVWTLPVVFVVINNQWAISTPRNRQSAASTLAQKAIAAGFEGEQVDGNDIIAVAASVYDALARARSGEGPHLVECLTYRLADHTTADAANRYRSEDEVSQWWLRDPIARLRAYLAEHAAWGQEEEQSLLASCQSEVDNAAQAYDDQATQPVTAMFDYLYATQPEALDAQRHDLASRYGSAIEDE
jgi:pyruvate dehydrogenase E1 component alpha subunit